MNQQKQVEKTDETYEVTAIAEMGVEYYRAQIIHLTNFEEVLLVKNVEENEKKQPKDQLSVETIHRSI